MSGISKFKRIYTEGAAAEHPDIAGQKEFAKRADAEIARRKAARAKKAGPQLPSFVSSVRKEETELDEKIDVGANISKTISDFVHSKSKTFKGDTKKQRIKRALGAYYAAQKEETENMYNYIIETLVAADYAENYEAAKVMFEHISDEFASNILEEYIEEKARGTRKKSTVHAYDVDETLFGHGKKGKPNVQVHVKDESGKRVQSLSNQEFNTHKLKKGHSYDFSEFQSAKKFRETSTPNKRVIKDIKRKQARGQNVHLITARSKFDDPKEFHSHLQKHGVNVPLKNIHYTGGMKGGDIGKKKVDVANAVAKQSDAKKTHMYDDAAKVHKSFEAEKKEKPVSKKIKTHMVAPDKSGESRVRSYQATKNEEMTSYEYWKQFINEEEKKNHLERQQELIDAGRQRLTQGNLNRQYLDQARRDFRSGKATSLQRLSLYKAGGGDAAIIKGPTVKSYGVDVTTMTKDDVIRKGLYATPQTQKPSSTEKKVVDATNIAGNKQKVTTNKNYGVTLSGHKGTATYGAGGERMIRANIGNAGVNQVAAGRAKVGQSYAAKLGGVRGTVKYDAKGNRSFQALQKPAAPKVK